ncbi:MAG TPA: TMEM175 family protein [Bryobacteraceae bacterium]|jgi:uncharacterized membrane protein|nr:TMEM175 family protein [Bryobacteraceae bacterium]
MEKETGRLEAFSDGVFAIAITLLVLELKVPHQANGEAVNSAALRSSLLRQWPSYLALATSFFTVLIMWVHHHTIFKLVRRADARLLFANGLLLLLVSVVPFPTAVVAEYLATPAASAACELYALVFVLISLAFYLTMWFAFRESTLNPDASRKTVERFRRDYKLGPPLYTSAVIAAPFSPLLSMGICTALWIFWAITTGDCVED